MTKQVELEGDWYDIPNTAKYVAQDKDGAWFWYQGCPSNTRIMDEWGSTIITLKGIKAAWGCITVVSPPKDFTEELYELVD